MIVLSFVCVVVHLLWLVIEVEEFEGIGVESGLSVCVRKGLHVLDGVLDKLFFLNDWIECLVQLFLVHLFSENLVPKFGEFGDNALNVFVGYLYSEADIDNMA